MSDKFERIVKIIEMDWKNIRAEPDFKRLLSVFLGMIKATQDPKIMNMFKEIKANLNTSNLPNLPELPDCFFTLVPAQDFITTLDPHPEAVERLGMVIKEFLKQ